MAQKIAWAATVAVLGLMAGQAAAADLPYLTLGLGSVSLTGTSSGADAAVASLRSQGRLVGSEVEREEERDAWLVGFGWPNGDLLALELTYADLGRISYALNVDGAPATGDTETRAIALTAVPDWEYGPVRLIGRIGLAYWERKTDLFASGLELVETVHGAGPLAGAGAELDLGRHGYRWRLRLEWQRYFSVGDDDTTGESDVDLLYAGIVIAR